MRVGRDDYTTPLAEWMKLRPLVPPGLKVWDPFYHDGRAARYLQEAFAPSSVLHQPNWIDLDAPAPPQVDCDVILTNVPFAQKDAAVRWLVRTGLPFVALVPFHTVTKKSFVRDAVAALGDDLEVIVVSGRIRFESADGVRMPRTASFPCVWIASGLGRLARTSASTQLRLTYL